MGRYSTKRPVKRRFVELCVIVAVVTTYTIGVGLPTDFLYMMVERFQDVAQRASTTTLTDSNGEPPPGDLKVDAFCIGAAKSGSTWLAKVVDEHPEIQVSSPKEPNFFTARGSPYLDRPPKGFKSSWRWYKHCFPSSSGVNIDFSIHTIADPGAPRRIRAVFPEAKFILILRDPVARLYSHYQHELRTKMRGLDYVQSLEPTFEQALENEEFVRRSCYYKQLEPWVKTFPKNQFHLMTMEAARADPLDHVQKVFSFLGVDDSVCPEGLKANVHPHRLDRGIIRAVRGGASWARMHGMGPAIAPIGRRFPWRLVKKIDKKKVRYSPLDANLEAKLRQMFLPEIEKTEQVFDVNLEEWKPSGST